MGVHFSGGPPEPDETCRRYLRTVASGSADHPFLKTRRRSWTIINAYKGKVIVAVYFENVSELDGDGCGGSWLLKVEFQSLTGSNEDMAVRMVLLDSGKL